MDNKANVNIQDNQLHTPLILACGHAHQAEMIIQKLSDRGADVHLEGLDKRTALHYAASRGLDINTLLKVGADPNAKDAEGSTPLHMAAQEACYHVMERLVQVGCDANTLNLYKKSPLHYAAAKGNLRCVQYLVKSGADMFQVDSLKNLPVWYAAASGFAKTVQYFVSHNVPLDPIGLQNKKQNYEEGDNHFATISKPLRVALEKKHFLIAKVLLLGGCDKGPLLEWITNIPPAAYEEFHNLALIEWLHDFTSNPQCLLQNCRLAIRKCLGINLTKKYDQLPLPLTVKKFIMMEDVDDELGSTASISETMMTLSSLW